MSKHEPPSAAGAAADHGLPRPGHGHASRGDDDRGTGQPAEAASDPHPAWLKELRRLRAGTEKAIDPSSADRVRWLQDKIAHTPAGTREGLLAQAELIADLAWNDIVAATARHLVAGIKRWPNPA